jgi:hypothetical protein
MVRIRQMVPAHVRFRAQGQRGSSTEPVQKRGVAEKLGHGRARPSTAGGFHCATGHLNVPASKEILRFL